MKTVQLPASERVGYTNIPNWIFTHADLSAEARYLLIVLRYYAFQKEECWPGQPRLAADLGMSDRQLRRHLVELSVAGLVQIERRGFAKGNIYKLLLPPDLSIQDTGGRNESSFRTPVSAHSGHGRPVKLAGYRNEELKVKKGVSQEPRTPMPVDIRKTLRDRGLLKEGTPDAS